MNDADDRILINSCISGDKDAWGLFVDQFRVVVESAIIKTFQRYSFHDDDAIADLFQNIFISLIDNDFKKLRQFKGKSKLSSWLYAVSVNAAIDFLRVSKNHLSLDHETEHGVNLQDTLANENPGPDTQLELNQEKQIFEEMKKELAPREKLFFDLYYVRELSVEKIASILNTNANNVYQLNSVVKNKMKKIAQKYL